MMVISHVQSLVLFYVVHQIAVDAFDFVHIDCHVGIGQSYLFVKLDFLVHNDADLPRAFIDHVLI